MKTRLINAALASALAVSAVSAGIAYAQSADAIIFPIGALGNCASEADCRAYCDMEENHEVCKAFAKEHGLEGETTDEHITSALADGGPGQCAAGAADPHEACRKYCDSSDHMRECVSYAKTHNLMDEHDLAEAEQVLAALDKGAPLPVGCTSKESCHALCETPPDVATARQCFAFAEAAGFLPPGVDRAKAEIVFKAIEEGRAPFKTPKEFEQCENPSSDEILQKCIDFGTENGFLSAEEAEMVKKTGGKGPGGCHGKEQCEAYCADNQDECFAFGVEHGMIKPEDKARMEGGMHRFKEGMANAPEEVKKCLEENLGADTLEQMLTGEKMPDETLGQKMHECFESAMGHGESGEMMQKKGEDGMKGESFPPKDGMETSGRSFKGPGGCTSPEECKQYCTKHPDDCGGMHKQEDSGTYPDSSGYANPQEIEKMMREKMMREGREQYFKEHEGQFPDGVSAEDAEKMMLEKQEQWSQYEDSYKDERMNAPDNYESYDKPDNTEPSPSEPVHSEPAPSEPMPTSWLPLVPGVTLVANVISLVAMLLMR